MGLIISYTRKTRVGIYLQPDNKPVFLPRTEVYTKFENITLSNSAKAVQRTSHLYNLIDEQAELTILTTNYMCCSSYRSMIVDLRHYQMLKDITKMTKQLLECARLMKVNTLTTSC